MMGFAALYPSYGSACRGTTEALTRQKGPPAMTGAITANKDAAGEHDPRNDEHMCAQDHSHFYRHWLSQQGGDHIENGRDEKVDREEWVRARARERWSERHGHVLPPGISPWVLKKHLDITADSLDADVKAEYPLKSGG